MSRILEFIFKETKRITLYIVVEDLENKLLKLADPYTLTTTTLPLPPRKKLNGWLRRPFLILHKSYYWMLLIDSPFMWSPGPVDWSHCNEHIAWPRSHSIPPFLSSAYEAFFLLLHSYLSFPQLTAGEIVRNCRAYKISLITEMKWNAVVVGGLHSYFLTRNTSILT